MVQLIFCANFALSCTMFELIIFEIIDHMERSSRYFHWILSLYVMLFMIIILTPFYLFYYVLSNIRQIPAHWLSPLCFVTWLMYIFVFWKIGDQFPIHNPKVRNSITISWRYAKNGTGIKAHNLRIICNIITIQNFISSMAYCPLRHVSVGLVLLESPSWHFYQDLVP